MPLISGSIPSLINGVSQQPATLRMPTQGEVQENGLSHITRGLEKRPATEHVAEITGVTSANSNDVFIHTIRRSEDEAYAFIVKGGVKDSSGTVTTDTQVKLIDLTGFATGTAGSDVPIKTAQVPISNTSPVTTSDPIDATVNKYLAIETGNTFEPNMFSSTTVADFSFILNKEEKVKKDTSSTQTTSNYQALVHIKTGDYGADYKVKVTVYNDAEMTTVDSSFGTAGVEEATFSTPDNKTESLTGHGSGSPTVNINNQAAVVVSNIARSLWQGDVDGTDVVTLAEGDGNPVSNGHAYVRDGTSGETVYTDTKGVIHQGTFSGTALNSLGGPFVYSTGQSNYNTGESIIYLESTKPFTIECTDGKGDTFMVPINGSDEVPNFGRLPGSKVPDNFVAKISGDKNSGQDDYYVKWTKSTYKETFRPKYPLDANKDSRKKLDNTTLPVQLFKAFDNSADQNIYFVLQPITYGERTVGDDTTNPFPSFANYDEDDNPNGLFTINDIFFHRNRLGFISDENVILSETADYFNYFATTVLSILDTAPVDVAVSNNQVAILKSAIPFQESLVLFSDLQQFKLTSDEFLTPTSANVDVATNFEVSTETKPVAAGKTIFFPFQRGAFSGIREYFIDIASQTNDANEITSHVPDYIEGTVKKLAVSSNEEVLCCIGDTDRKELIVYKYYYTDQEKLQSSWSKWKFDAEIIDMEFIGSVGFMLFRRGTKIYLEKLNLSVDNATATMDDKVGVRLDRRVKLEATTFDTNSPTVADAPSGHISSLTITEAGSSYSGDGTLSATGGGGSSFAGTYTVVGGAITSVTITNKGTGYTSAPTIVLSGSTSGTSAVVTPTLNKKWEEGKTHTDLAQTSTSGNGSGIKFTVETDSLGNPTFTITDNGQGYAEDDTITFTDPGISSNTAVLTVNLVGTQMALSKYYSDVQHDKVGAAIEKTISAINTSTNTFTSTAHGFENDYRVHFTSTSALPAGIESGVKYFIVSKTDNDFKIAKVKGGSTHVITSVGSGTIKAVFDDVKAKGVDDKSQFGKKITIDNVSVVPRVGQTFTSNHDANNTYTVVDVGVLSGDTVEIEITPSIAPELSIDQGGPIPNNTMLMFEERSVVYVVETGEVIQASQVAGVLQNGTTYSKSRDNSTPVIFAGIPYDFKYQFSEQFVKSGETSINSGRLQMRNFEISYDRTGFFEVEVSPKPFDNRLRKIFKRTFTGRRIGSLFLGKQELDTGVFRVPVYVNSKDVKITVSSDSWLPLSLQSADYEAFQVLRNQRI